MSTYAIKVKREYPNVASKDDPFEPLFGNEFYMLRVIETETERTEQNPTYQTDVVMHIQDGLAPSNTKECFDEICIEIETDDQELDFCSLTGIHTCISAEHRKSELILSSFVNSIFQLEQLPVQSITILPIHIMTFLKELNLSSEADIRLLVLGQTKQEDEHTCKTFLNGEHYDGIKLIHLPSGKHRTLFHQIRNESNLIHNLNADLMTSVLSACGLHNSSKETVMIVL